MTKERERDRERQRERQRETERETETETDRQTGRQAGSQLRVNGLGNEVRRTFLRWIIRFEFNKAYCEPGVKAINCCVTKYK